uniref:Testis development related protein n=4 Tax=Neoaves TaxID=3078114 RepID=A0A8D0L0D7_STROC
MQSRLDLKSFIIQLAALSVVAPSSNDCSFNFCLLKPLELFPKLPGLPSYCDTLKWSQQHLPAEEHPGPSVLTDVTCQPLQTSKVLYSLLSRKELLLQEPNLLFFKKWPSSVQGASFRGWKEVTSMFNKDDEQQLLAGCKSPKSKGTNLKLKEEMKSEKKPGFWDSLVIKQNVQSRKPDEIEGWEPPQITAADSTSDAATTLSDYTAWSGWEDETKGSTKYTNLASSGNSSRWSIKSAGKLVSIRRQSKGNLTDNWEELE